LLKSLRPCENVKTSPASLENYASRNPLKNKRCGASQGLYTD